MNPAIFRQIVKRCGLFAALLLGGMVLCPRLFAAAPAVSLSVPSTVFTGQSFNVTVIATDSDGDLNDLGLRYQGIGIIDYWPPVIGGSYYAPTVSVTAPGSPGTINLRGEVFDQASNGTTGSWYSISVVANHAPTASLTPSSTTVFVGQYASWNFSTSDSDSNLYRWRFYYSTNPSPAWTYVSGGYQSGSYGTTFGSTGSYQFIVDTEDTVGATGYASATFSVVNGPSASAASSVSASGFTANWSSATGATKYRLDVSTNSGFSSYVSGYQNLDASTATSYGVSGLSAGTTYYYRVRAENSWGASQNSNTTTVVTIPSAPTASSATGLTSSGLTANWSAASGATGYRLDVSTSSSFSSYVGSYNNLSVGSVTSYGVTGLSASTTYYYRVRAENSGGASGNSSTITAMTLASPPAAPTASAATSITGTGLTANWSASSGATGYRLDVSTNSGFSSYVGSYNNLSVGNVTSYAVTGLASSTTYYYRVRAENSGGSSGNSSTITATTATAPQNDTSNLNQLNIHIPLSP